MRRSTITIVLLLSAAVASYALSTPAACPTRKTFDGFPRDIGQWRMVEESFVDDATLSILKADDYFMRSYANPEGEVVGIYVVYFLRQVEGGGIHSPRQCLPGAGWTPVETSAYNIPVSQQPGYIPANKFLMEKGDERQLCLFWYQGRGRQYASEYWNKLYLVWDAMTRGRTDGALVVINMTVSKDPCQPTATASAFVEQLAPKLSEYIPE
jgi:EpsI family protein